MTLKKSIRQLPILFLLFFAEFDACSQEKIILKGQIISDSISTANIHVVNLNLEIGTTSDLSGNFSIYSRQGDTLQFSSVQFEKKQVVITQSDLDTGKITIKLLPARNELDEVRISDLKLSGYLESDLPKINYFDRNKYGIPYPKKRPSQTERRLYTANANITSRWQYIGVLLGGAPIDVIINDINGRTKYLKALDKQDKLQILVEHEIEKMGRTFFIEDLGLPDSEIENFVYYCTDFPEYKNLISDSNRLNLIEFYSSKLEGFINLRQINLNAKD